MIKYETPVVVDLSKIARADGQVIESCSVGNMATGCQVGAEVGLDLLCWECMSGAVVD